MMFEISSKFSCMELNKTFGLYVSKASICKSLCLEAQVTKAPKRPPTSYFRFIKEIRPNIVKEHPNMNMIEISKIIGQKYRELSDAQKEVKHTGNIRTPL